MNTKSIKRFFVLIAGWVLPVFISAQTTYTFSNCSATGQTGPTQAQVNAAYLGSNLQNSVTIVTQGIQQFTIPSTGGYRIQADGAMGGGTNANGSWGLGASIAGDFTLNAGTVIRIVVGQAGACNNGSHGSGGGGSYVATGTVPLVVAGGGGGRGASSGGLGAYSHGTTVTAGQSPPSGGPGGTGGGGGASASGTAGGTSVTPGGSSGGSCWSSGGGGFYTNGGMYVSNAANGGRSFLSPGNALGGDLNTQCANGAAGGFGGGGGCGDRGAGGGGFSGGGGGTNNSEGGGGGGSFNGGINQTNISGTVTGNGRVLITRLCNIQINSSAPNGLGALCTGQSVTLTTNAVSGISWSTGGTGTSVVVSPSVTTTYSVTGTSTANCLASSIIQLTVNSSVPSLTVSTTGNNICLGQAVALTGSGALTYTWINAGVTQGNAFTPSVTTTYTLLGQNGCGTSTALTTVTVAPLQVAAISSNSIVCASNTASLTCAAAATGFTWQPVGTTGANIVVSPTANTIYTVTASNGTCLGSATVAVNTNPNPTISIAASGSVACQGSAITMTASGGITYTWYPGASNGATYTAMPTAPTLYSVAGTNSFGCTTWANQVVLTNSSPTISISASNTLVCGGTNVTLTASGASSYSWNTGATTAGINDTPQGTTVYTVQGTANGCASSNTIQVSVFNPVLSISGPTSVCRGQTASLTASAADSYTWSNGSPFAGVVVTPTVSTVYSVAALTSTGNLTCPSSASVNVVVNPLPTVTAVASKTSVCRGQSFTLTASGATTYSWNTGATTASLVTSSTLVANINYTVQGTDANGCTNTSVITIKVNSCIGINELNTAQITVYPNPSKGIFELRDITEVMHIEVYTITGQRILSQSSTESTRLDLSQQPKGIYLLKLSQNGTEAAQYKLIRD